MLFVLLGGLEYDGGEYPGIDCRYSSKSVKLTWQATSCHLSMMSFQSFSSCAGSRRASWSDSIMVLHRVDCGLPRFHRFMTQAARRFPEFAFKKLHDCINA